jgi:arylsulfatase A-like enzyme
LETAPIVGDEILEHIDRYYDNRLDNIGRKDSFVWYGTRWAQAATAPSRLYKMFSTQGGCRVPLVVKPIGRAEQTDHHITDAFCTVMDCVPTMLDYAGLRHPETYRGRPVEAVRGVSWKPFLDASRARPPVAPDPFAIHGENHVTGWEMCGSGGLRKGRYKITYVPRPKGPQRWELFDILQDPGETTDLSSQQPDVLNDLLQHWAQYVQEVGVVGLAGEYDSTTFGNASFAVKDEFDDTGRWIRFIGKDNVPASVRPNVPT